MNAANQRKSNWKLKLEVLAAYGSVCKCCGEWRTEFLAIDHIKGGGLKHRKSLQKTGAGWKLNIVLRRDGYPSGYQVLCHNCNQSKGFYGYCPHKDGAFVEPNSSSTKTP